MIRPVTLQDATALTAIYNEYILHSTATFEVHPIDKQEMQKRIAEISSDCPYFVYETDGKIIGYCYAHPWKIREAYSRTWETTIYIARGHEGKGAGKQLMQQLIEACRHRHIHVLIACITSENTTSRDFHAALGFKQVSSFDEVGRKFGRWLGITDYQLIL